MSFTTDVKNEICKSRGIVADNKFAAAYGMLAYGKTFSIVTMSLHTENKPVAKLYSNLLFELADIKTSVTIKEHYVNGRKIYIDTVDTLEDRMSILAFFGHKNSKCKVTTAILRDENEKKAFLAGAYLSCGNVSDPKKSYHLEYACENEHLASLVIDIFSFFNITMRKSTRRGQVIVYTKDSSTIESVLVLIGATKASLRLMDVKIYKDIRNNVNRVTNCEAANIEKTISAAATQVRDIQYIMDCGYFNGLKSDIKKVAMARIENPDYSLTEITKALKGEFSRSAVDRRLTKISKFANELRQNKN